MLRALLTTSLLCVAPRAAVGSGPADGSAPQTGTAPLDGWISIELLRDATLRIENQSTRQIVVRGARPDSPRTPVAPGAVVSREARHGATESVYYTDTLVELTEEPSRSFNIDRINIESLPRFVIEMRGDTITIRDTPRSEILGRDTIGAYTILGPASPGGAVTRVSDRVWIRNPCGEWLAGHLTLINEADRPIAAYRVDLDPDHDVSVEIPEIDSTARVEFRWIPFDASLRERRIGQREVIDWKYAPVGMLGVRGGDAVNSRQYLTITDRRSGNIHVTTGLRDRVPESWISVRRDENWQGEIETSQDGSGVLAIVNRTNRPISVAPVADLLWTIDPPSHAIVIAPGESGNMASGAGDVRLRVWPPEAHEPIGIFTSPEHARSIHSVSAGSVDRVTALGR